MLEPVDCNSNFILFGEVMLRVTKDRDTDRIEIVRYPSDASVTVREAKKPYQCTLHLADGSDVWVDLACTEDWGDIQDCSPDECSRWPALGWGNDSDGHVEIIGVTDARGNLIPLDEFERDVEDFIIHHED